jgi:hypothetical protein
MGVGAGNEDKDKELEFHSSHCSSEGMLLMTGRSPTRCHVLKVPIPPYSTKLGTKSLPHGPLGDTNTNHSTIEFYIIFYIM